MKGKPLEKSRGFDCNIINLVVLTHFDSHLFFQRIFKIHGSGAIELGIGVKVFFIR